MHENPTKRTSSLQELDITHRLHIVQGILLALAVLSKPADSWAELEQLDAADALATVGREMLSDLRDEVTERSRAHEQRS